MFCRYCGNKLPDDAKFCNSCGAEQAQPTVEPQISIEEHSSAPVVKTIAYRTTGFSKVPSFNPIKIVAIVAVLVFIIIIGLLIYRGNNERKMLEQIPKTIFNDSQDMVFEHYDQVMAYPHDHDLGYTYEYDTSWFNVTVGDDSNTYDISGAIYVVDKSQENYPSYQISVFCTVTTNFLRTDWDADWRLTYQDPEYSGPTNSDVSNDSNS